MNYEDFYKVRTLVDELRDLESKIQSVKNTGLGVTIDGRYHEELANAVRLQVVVWLEDRRDEKKRELVALGVGFPPSRSE